MQISARFVNNWHYSVKQWNTLHNTNKQILDFNLAVELMYAVRIIIADLLSQQDFSDTRRSHHEKRIYCYDVSFFCEQVSALPMASVYYIS